MPALSISPFQTMYRSPLFFSAYENLWSAIFSQDEEKVKDTVKILDQEAVEYVNYHLKITVSENGWQPAQQASAAFAL